MGTSASGASAHETIAKTVNGDEVRRPMRAALELPPQARHVDIDGPGRGRRIVFPDALDELVARERRPFVLEEIAEQAKLLGAQIDHLAVSHHGGAARVDAHVVEMVHVRRGMAW